MGFFDERDTPDGLVVRLFMTRHDLERALEGEIVLSHQDERTEDAGEVHRVIVKIAPEPGSEPGGFRRTPLRVAPPIPVQ